MPLIVEVDFQPLPRSFSTRTYRTAFFRKAGTEIRVLQSVVQSRFRDATPKVSGGASRSWKTGFNRQFKNEVRGDVFSRHPATGTLETGAVPHRPPPENLKPWLIRKFGLTGRRLDSVAFKMSERIAREGLPLGSASAGQIYSRAVERLSPLFQKSANSVGARAIASLRTGG